MRDLKPKPPPLFVSLFLLLFFNNIINGDDMTILQNLIDPLPSKWSANKGDPCKWDGIKCEGKRVTELNLASEGLIGTLNPNLNQLTMLQTISMQTNQLSGELPSFQNLSNLRQIYLDKNNFTKVPPSCFSGLTSLATLSLSNIKFETWEFPKELADSELLMELDLANTGLTGVLPDIFGKLISLQVVKLSYNNFTGSLPKSFSGSHIVNFTVNDQLQGFSGGMDVIGTMPELAQVWLHGNQFSGPIPDLSNCTNMNDLSLRNNQLTGIVPPSITLLPNLKSVALQNNKLQGPMPQFAPGVTANVGADTNNFCTNKPGEPCDPQVMTLLQIVGAMGYPMSLAQSWEGNDPCASWMFITCTGGKITRIIFGKQGFAGSISPAYANLTSLISLSLDNNNLSGQIPDSLTKLPDLTSLDVSNNKLTGKIPTFSSKVKVTTAGNPLLGTDPPAGGDGGGGESSADSSGDGSGGGGSKSGSHSKVGLIVGVSVGVVALLGIVAVVSRKYYITKHPKTFGRVPNYPPNGKEVASNGSTSRGMIGFGGVGNELQSQSSDDFSDAQFFEGGNVAISIQVLRQVTNNFSEENILGRGGFGIVYKGVLHDGTQIAVKRMESNAMGTKGLKEFQAEIAVLTKVRHRHLVALLGFCTNGNERLLVYEYMPQGNLGQHLFEWRDKRIAPLTWMQRVTVALDVARGVEYLHSLAQQSFIHRDLKSSNILLGDDMRAKVADFGLVKNAPDGKFSVETRLAGTFGYLAPEYAVTGRVTTKVDVYAYGVVLMEIITGRPALDDSMPEESSHLVTWFRRAIVSNDGVRKAIDPTLDPDEETFRNISKVIELAGHCTSREPSQRPDMGHAVNVLGPLVEQWKPSDGLEDDLSINLDLSLPQALQRWRENEGTSTMDYGMSFGNTQSSIPPNGGNTFHSGDGR
ncbi:Receptor-like kinase tmk4 [Thalictrum thalictroides]|uniref:non-specific serine/threonine protein kinase n=1 Tax=Thalictrum thalictroides TaxID=46969 RepID=A0A7J6WX81_THATH|nr:Receptor-like kinase tmk4 [Thalictrum thalictroides]